MPPHEGLVHLKEYDIKDSNVELIGSDIDHRVKYNSAASEPAWNNGLVGQECGLFIWRIENFEVVPWPKERTGEFYDGDSYIVLHSYKVEDKLCHDIFFWLGSKTTQDEAGTAAYKTVELDEFLRGTATQHREVQAHPSPEFMALFRRLCVRSGGVRSGFNHVETNEQSSKEAITLLRIFKHPAAARADSVIVHEVEPTWESLDDHDVFVLDQGQKIWVWQGKNCSPMEKAKAAQVVNDMTLAKHLDVEVLSQLESRSKIIVDLLGGKDTSSRLSRRRGLSRSLQEAIGILFRLSDATGAISFDLVKDGQQISPSDLDGNDVFLCDTGSRLWVWQGSQASKREKALWLNVAQSYIRQIQEARTNPAVHLIPISNVVQGHESPAFWKAIRV
ncbi:hypothetical protein GB937_006938 [Aspergillus fischeri]|nr:hypothetical protein GB937_006938 [Aspergillus fischeri]